MKRKLLCGILAAAAVSAALPSSAAAAAAAAPVRVDGEILEATAYLTAGVTYVPLRALLDALGGWEVTWDDSRQAASAEHADGRSLTASPGNNTVSVDGTAFSGSVWVEDGRTYVPLRGTATACGASVSWDKTLGCASVVTGEAPYSDEDLYWLSRIISAESRGEALTGQIAVGNVVLNRVAASEFPGTIREVIFDRHDGVQFEPVSNGTIYDTPTASSVAAAQAALRGQRPVGACLYFYAPALSQGVWVNANRTYYTTIGCHRFYL